MEARIRDLEANADSGWAATAHRICSMVLCSLNYSDLPSLEIDTSAATTQTRADACLVLGKCLSSATLAAQAELTKERSQQRRQQQELQLQADSAIQAAKSEARVCQVIN